jgi:tartrate-resistant acid phosphatase type 5
MNSSNPLKKILTCFLLFTIYLPVTVLSQTSIRFAVIGDYGWQGQANLDVSNLVKSWNPDFIITTGDNNYDYGEATTIDQNVGQYYHEFIYPYSGSYGAGAVENRFYPILGNHDWLQAGAIPYLNYFTLPGNERYYDFVKGPVQFFALDSDGNEPDGNSNTSTQAVWFQNRLAASSSPWKIVYIHTAPYSSGWHHGSNIKSQWQFKQWGASAVLSGHEHNYERLIENDLVYFVNGAGGKSLYTFNPPISGSIVRYCDDYGAQLVTATDTSLTFQFITRTGVIVDTYTLYAGLPTYTINVSAGWNLLSLPSKVPNNSVTQLFPTAISSAFVYSGGTYQLTDTLTKGNGFWLKFSSADQVQIYGDSLYSDTIDVVTGWNMIGTVSKPVAIMDIQESTPGMVISDYFGYNLDGMGSYTFVTTLLPGYGYWVKVNQNGKLILH